MAYNFGNPFQYGQAEINPNGDSYNGQQGSLSPESTINASVGQQPQQKASNAFDGMLQHAIALKNYGGMGGRGGVLPPKGWGGPAYTIGGQNPFPMPPGWSPAAPPSIGGSDPGYTIGGTDPFKVPPNWLPAAPPGGGLPPTIGQPTPPYTTPPPSNLSPMSTQGSDARYTPGALPPKGNFDVAKSALPQGHYDVGTAAPNVVNPDDPKGPPGPGGKPGETPPGETPPAGTPPQTVSSIIPPRTPQPSKTEPPGRVPGPGEAGPPVKLPPNLDPRGGPPSTLPTQGNPPPNLPPPPTLPTDPSGINPQNVQQITDYLHNMLAPGQQNAQNQLSRSLNAQAALTGDINSGGYGDVYGRSMGNLIAQQNSSEGQMGEQFANDQFNRTLQKYGIDVNAVMQQYIGQLGAATNIYGTTSNYNLGLTNADVERENNIMRYILGSYGLAPSVIAALFPFTPGSLIAPQPPPTNQPVTVVH